MPDVCGNADASRLLSFSFRPGRVNAELDDRHVGAGPKPIAQNTVLGCPSPLTVQAKALLQSLAGTADVAYSPLVVRETIDQPHAP